MRTSFPKKELYYGGGAVAALLVLRHLLSPKIELRLHVIGPDGYVEADPGGLARAAGTSLPAYALASMMASEERRERGQLAVGRAAWNAARGSPARLVRLLLPRRRLGSQEVNPYAATSRPPTGRTLDLALAVLAGRVPDLVEGATRWDAPAAQDRLHAEHLRDPARHPKYRKSSAEVAAARVAEGFREVGVPGVPDTRFWTRRAA